MGDAYIVAAARTAGGKRGGKLKDWHPVDMGAEVINALLDRSKADPNLIDRTEDRALACLHRAADVRRA